MNILYKAVIALHALCLDVVGIALLWYLWAGNVLGVDPEFGPILILGLAVWLVYMGDHFLDIHQNKVAKIPLYRYSLLSGHLYIFLKIYIFTLATSAIAAYIVLTKEQFLHGLILFAACSVYMGYLARGKSIGKEMAVALIFWAGVQVFYYYPEIMDRSNYLYFSLSFLLLLYLNASLVAYWEIYEDRARGVHSIAIRWPGGYQWYYLFTTLLALSGLLHSTTYPISLSATLLMLLHFLKEKVSGETMRLLGDWTLLAPLVFLI